MLARVRAGRPSPHESGGKIGTEGAVSNRACDGAGGKSKVAKKMGLSNGEAVTKRVGTLPGVQNESTSGTSGVLQGVPSDIHGTLPGATEETTSEPGIGAKYWRQLAEELFPPGAVCKICQENPRIYGTPFCEACYQEWQEIRKGLKRVRLYPNTGVRCSIRLDLCARCGQTPKLPGWRFCRKCQGEFSKEFRASESKNDCN